MKHKHLVAAAAISASVIGGAAGGALLFTPGSSGAAEGTTTLAASEAATGAAAPAGTPAPGPRGDRADVLATAAKALGMTEAELRTALDGGKTIADVAKDKGVDIQKVVDALVAEAKAKLEQAEADLPARMTDLVNGKLPARGPDGDHGGRGRFGGGFEAGLDTVATTLGVSETDLRTALESGKTIADVAKEKGVSVDTLVSKLVAAATTRIDQAVTDGKLTADQATGLKGDLKERITAMVNGTRPAGGPGFGHGGGPGRGAGFGGPQGEGASTTGGTTATPTY